MMLGCGAGRGAGGEPPSAWGGGGAGGGAGRIAGVCVGWLASCGLTIGRSRGIGWWRCCVRCGTAGRMGRG